jgi:hypothetical protein
MKCWRFALFAIFAVALAVAACGPHHHHGDDDYSPAADDDNDTATPDDDDNDDASPHVDDDASPDDDDDMGQVIKVLAVGAEGTILRYDGQAWSKMISNSTSPLNGVWGASTSDIFVVASPGTILHYDGSAWSTMANFSGGQLYAVWGSSGSDVYAVGWFALLGLILHYDGDHWSVQELADPGAGPAGSFAENNITGIWGSSKDQVFAVGYWDVYVTLGFESWGGSVFEKTGSNSWSVTGTFNAPQFQDTYAVWGTSPSDVFAGGNYIGPDGQVSGNYLIHYDGSGWSTMIMPTPDQSVIKEIWGSSPTDVFATGQSSTAEYIYHYDGTTWTVSETSSTLISGIWGASATDVYVVGGDSRGALILHYDGSAWSTMLSGEFPSVGGVWGFAN